MRKFKCSGCHAYESKGEEDFASCNNIPYIKDHVCPCISCLIKTMCNKVCENYILYLAWIDQNYPHMLKQRTLLHDTILKEAIKHQTESLVNDETLIDYKPLIKSTVKYNGE